MIRLYVGGGAHGTLHRSEFASCESCNVNGEKYIYWGRHKVDGIYLSVYYRDVHTSSWDFDVALNSAVEKVADELSSWSQGLLDWENNMFSFSVALEYIKEGKKVARTGWNGKGMFLFLVPGSTFTVNRPPLLGIYPEGTSINYHSHVDMRTADGTVVPWLCSQTDMLSDDWCLVD